MKNATYLTIALVAIATTFASCSSEEEKDVPTVINIEAPDSEPSQESSPAPQPKEEDNQLEFKLNTDEDGKISGGVSGELELKK